MWEDEIILSPANQVDYDYHGWIEDSDEAYFLGLETW